MLDFYVVCHKMKPLITSMTIDKSSLNSLTKYKGEIVRSDHMKLEMEAILVFHKEQILERFAVFNVRNKACQEKILY